MRELAAAEVYRRCDPGRFDFETTADLAPPLPEEALPQPRALAAIELGLGLASQGYNVYALGPPRLGKHQLVRRFLEQRAARRPVPPDVCYVHDFDGAQRPRLLRLPAGRGSELRGDMEELVEELATALAAAFESEEYQERRQALEGELEQRHSEAFQKIQEKAKERGLATLRTPTGVLFAPLSGEDVLSPKDFEALPEEERRRVEEEVAGMQQELQKLMRQLPAWQREARGRMRDLHREVARIAVRPHFDQMRQKYAELDAVLAYLDTVFEEVVANPRDFVGNEEKLEATAGRRTAPLGADGELGALRRFTVNLLVDHAKSTAAPVVYEDNPSYQNLVGRIEHRQQMGALVTDFGLIRAGSLHRANGGYLLVEAERILTQPFAWQALKRALQSQEVKVESLGQTLSLVSTVSLEPEPMPLDVKVVLLGSRSLYYLLAAHDPDFGKLFKVAADFDNETPWNEAGELGYARLVAAVVRRESLRPFDRGAVARVVEHGGRLLGDAAKLSTATESVEDLAREASYWAERAGREVVTAADVDEAIDRAVERADRPRRRIEEEIERRTLLIATDGARVGQVNGLATFQLGDTLFGRPSRITARVRMGKGEVVNIEREVKLSGPIHSKGVLILSSFLGARYAVERTLSLAASLVFEQSYGGIDGDSASAAELIALLSAIATVPLRQELAITGSVNQYGEIQAIGGVNEKIEGFFRVCAGRGLTGTQGVIIPTSNVQHLMVRREVVEAVAAGRFHLYAIDHVDEGIELLTGLTAGAPDADGHYPEGSFNRRVEDRLAELDKRRKKASADGNEEDAKDEVREENGEPPAPEGKE